MTETTTDKPQLTKTDAKELKALVRSDTKATAEELRRRYHEIRNAIDREREQMEKENEKEATKEVADLMKDVKALNEKIVSKLNKLSDAGWTKQAGYRGPEPINPHDFTVSLKGLNNLIPPTKDNPRSLAIELDEHYRAAERQLERQEADMIRDLTLRSVTSEAARDFILSMPTPEQLLPVPDSVQLEAGNEG